jgi:hypothetical protein
MHCSSAMADRSQRRSTESYGLGQSGYTAGRREADPALERYLEVRNRGYPRGLDEDVPGQGEDDRWTGRGGSPWVPESVSTDDRDSGEQKLDEQKIDEHEAGEQG